MNDRAKSTPSGPLTYVISYTEGNTVSGEWAERVRNDPPDLLHHGHDIPLNSIWGPTRGYSAWEPDQTGSSADIRVKIPELRRGIDRLHDLGVRYVIPYVNHSIMGGTPPVRGGDTASARAQCGGLFHFWQRRAQFADLGLDRIPESDPLDWLQRCAMSFAPYKNDSPFQRFEPCLRQEPFLQYHETVVRLIAEAGYDGYFSDDNLVSCYCPVCARDFRAFLESEYSDRIGELTANVPHAAIMPYSDDGRGCGPAQRRATTGELSDGPAFGADPWATLLWEASQAFWSETNADTLARMNAAGRAVNENFFIVANWGMSAVVSEFGVRRRLGHDFRRWLRGARWQMLEEAGSRGFIAPGLVADFLTPSRVLAAHGAEPALLTYARSDPRQAELGYGEIAATGCGAYLEGGPTKLVSTYREFFQRESELFDGAQPYGPVALYYSLDEIHRNNDDHLRLFYAAARALGRSHIPFRIVTREHVCSGLGPDIEVLINPGAYDLPDSGLPVLTIGADGEKPERLIAPEEIELDRMLELPAAQQEEALASWSAGDLRGPAPLAEALRRLLKRDCALTRSTDAHAVRLVTYTVPSRKLLVIHVVNYGWATMSAGIAAPGTSVPFELRIPHACDGSGYREREPVEAWTVVPGSEGERVGLPERDGCATLTVPPTDAYRVIAVRFQ